MSLIRRIRDEQFDRLQAESAALDVSEREEKQLAVRRFEVVRAHLVTVANGLGEELTPLSAPTSSLMYFIFGDAIIMVQLFRLDLEKPDPGDARRLTTEYCVFILAVDGRDTLVQRKVGMLGWLTYEGIASVISQAPPDYDFSADLVRSRIS